MMVFDLDRFKSEHVLGIIRGVKLDSLQGVVDASLAGGLRFLEITLNTPNSTRLIENITSKYSPEQLTIGAGTVLTVDDAQRAYDAGAQFIVAPDFNESVAMFCADHQLAYFPGALTPTEICRAWEAGATMVKVFPASHMGSSYFKVIKGPLEKVKLMAVGGVKPANISQYLAAGADAVALGGSIFTLDRMEKKQFSEIQKEIEEFMFEVKNFYSKIPPISLANHPR